MSVYDPSAFDEMDDQPEELRLCETCDAYSVRYVRVLHDLDLWRCEDCGAEQLSETPAMNGVTIGDVIKGML